MATLEELASRAFEDDEGGSPIPRKEPKTWPEKLQRVFEDSLDDARRLDNPLVNSLIGSGTAIAHEVGSIASTLSSQPISPMNAPIKAMDALISGKPSDLIRPQWIGGSPMQEELDRLLGTLDEVYRGDSDSVTYSKFLGQFLPSLYAGSMVANATRGVMLKAAPSLLKTAGERKLLNQFLPRVAKASKEAGVEVSENALKRSAGTMVGGVPIFERTLMAAGNGMGFGAFEATRELSQSGEVGVALKVGGSIAVAGPALEMGIVGVGRRIFPSFRATNISTTKLEERFKRLAPDLQEQMLAGDASSLKIRSSKLVNDQNKDAIGLLTRGEAAMAKLVDQGVMEAAPGFLEMTKKMTVAERSSALKAAVANYKKRGMVDTDKIQKQVGLLDPGTERILASEFLGPTAKKLVKGERKLRRKKALGKIKKVQSIEEELMSSYHNINAMNFGITVSPNLRLAWTDTPMSAAQKLEACQKFGDALAETAARQKGGVFGMTHPGTRARLAANAAQQGWHNFGLHVTEPARAAIFEAPASMAKKMGVSGLRFLELFEQASTHARLDKSRLFRNLNKMTDDIADIMERPGGLKDTHPHYRISGVNREGNAHLKPIRDLWESTGSLKAIEKEFGEEIASLWEKEVVNTLDHFGRGLRNIGVNSMMSDMERANLRTPGYFPQVTRRTVDYEALERAMRSSMEKAGMKSKDIDVVIGAGEYKRSGAAQFGTIDQQRKLPGTTKEKIAGTYGRGNKPTTGLPFEDDPIVALKDHFDASTTRLHLGTRFGGNFELGTFYKMAMIDEGASEVMASSLVDAALFQSIPNNFYAKMARNVTSSQIMAKLSWAAIPNAFQTTLTGIRMGPKSTLIGMKQAGKDFASNARIAKAWQDTLATSDKEVIAQSLGLLEKSLMSTTTLFSGRHPQTMMERVAEKYMGAIGFNMTERMNRVIAAHSGLAEARQLIDGIASRKLIGTNLVNARNSLDSLGVNIDKVLKRYKATGRLGLSEGELDSVVTQSVKQTQFTTGPMDVPRLWRTPTGRVLAQFKSFAFNSGRLIRDQVFKEFDRGNYKPILYFASLGTMSGEMIGLTLDLAKNRDREPPNGLMRIVEDISNFGGFGLAMTMANATIYDHPWEAVLGPMASDISGTFVDIGQAIYHQKPELLGRTLGRQPVSKLAKRGFEIGAGILDASADVLDTGWYFEPSSELDLEPMSREDLAKSMREAYLRESPSSQ
jgi:hypothetical protein